MKYNQVAQTQSDKKTKCGVENSDGTKCKNKLGAYPEYCWKHSLELENLAIRPSNIPNAGYGLYAGPYGYKKGDLITQYGNSWNEVPLKTLEKRCELQKDFLKEKSKDCWEYVFCNDFDSPNSKCYDGLDIRSTIGRYANDAHQSNFRNNAYFEIIKGKPFIIASRTIKPFKEIFVSYGKFYWN